MNDYPRALVPEIPTPWLPEARRSLAGLGLSPDWPEESYAIPGQRAQRTADCALRMLADLGLRPDRLVPGLEGGVTLGFTARDRYAEIELRDDGEVIATCAGGNPGTLRVWPVSDLRNALQTIHAFLGG